MTDRSSEASRGPSSRAGLSEVPANVRELAERRSAARAAHDWTTADGLRGEIEAAGWKVVDRGTAFRLEPARPADVELDGVVRYGRSDAVPSRLDEEPSGLASVIVVAREDAEGSRRAASAVLAHAPAGVDVVLVADGLADEEASTLDAALASEPRVEIVRTSSRLGQAAALNIGLRRCRAPAVIVLDASVEATGDVATPLAAALDDPAVAIAGPFGLSSHDLRHFEETTTGPAAAIAGYATAFRRSDAAVRGPLDEAFRFYRNLDVWWSLVLRDEGPGNSPREARVVEGLALRRHPHLAWSSVPARERARLSKRNFYRILDRFRDRLELAD